MVQLGDDHRAGHADLAAFLPQGLGRFVDALVGRDHEQCAIGGPQPGPQLTHEVGVPRGVDEVDLDAVVSQRGDRKAHRALLPDLRLVEVADRGALGDRARPGQHLGRHQESLDEGGLAAPRGPHQNHVANAAGPVCGGSGGRALGSIHSVGHGFPPVLRGRFPWCGPAGRSRQLFSQLPPSTRVGSGE
ncbi:Uncharacterised protein [Mycobacterium tuberculosis]|nr:Uncharacterised protein [Mycobacterium tuberculosis]CKS19272.1 Uncharacterised protein [Mycobacterium tuberculosis]CKS93522.1 Uncharacterised protein [Mycobacterium tuberculosis]CNV93033.1 Uncharacterised protein [Mycobacterium tuberculosis]